MPFKDEKEKLALISKEIVNLLARHNLTVYEAESVLERTKISIGNTTTVQALKW